MGEGGARLAAAHLMLTPPPSASRKGPRFRSPLPARALCEDNAVMGVLLYHGGEQ